MFSGFQEILLIVLIVLGIVILPRLLGRRRLPISDAHAKSEIRLRLTGFLRLAIFASVAWLLATAAYLEPWKHPGKQYIFVGAGQVAVFWGLSWIISGFRKYRK